MTTDEAFASALAGDGPRGGYTPKQIDQILQNDFHAYLVDQAEHPHHHHPLDDGPSLIHAHPWDPADEDSFASTLTHSHAQHYGACEQDCTTR